MPLTNTKYKLQFKSILGTGWSLLFIDKNNTYDDSVYPKLIKGSGTPVVLKYNNDDNDIYSPIVASELDIELTADGTFDVNEFSDGDERSWKIELYKSNMLHWQGWLITDGIGSPYDDDIANTVTLTATDGLASLKGKGFADGVLEVDPTTGYVPEIFGIISLVQAFKYCLDQLDYDYGYTTIFSSLRFINNGNINFIPNQWLNVGIWADQFYDSDGIANDSYTVLQKLLTGFGLSMFQEKGSFYLRSATDMFYSQSQSLKTTVQESSQKLDQTFATQTNGTLPGFYEIGFDKPLKPRDNDAAWSNDYAYRQIKMSIDFNQLALLYGNPSFEIDAVAGQPPQGFYQHNPGVPGSGLTQDDAYDGVWSLKMVSVLPTPDAFIEVLPPFFTINQVNKQLNVSFMWKVPNPGDTGDFDLGYTFAFVPIFLDGQDGTAYFLKTTDYKARSLQTAQFNETDLIDIPEDVWQAQGDLNYTEGDSCSIKGTPTKDFEGWQSYSITSPKFPGSGIGHLTIRFYSVKYVAFDTSKFPIPGNAAEKKHVYVETGAGETGYYLIDNLDITISDYDSNGYNKQVGEIHLITNNSPNSKSQTKEVDTTLVSYPFSRFVVGNVFYGLDYLTAISTTSMWLFKLSYLNRTFGMRLPEAIIRQIAKSYQKSYRMWTGSLLGDMAAMFGLYSIRFFEDKKFIPNSYTHDLKASNISITLREIADSDFNYTYQYAGKYEKSAKNI